MKLVCDESVDRRIAERLRADGLDMLHVADSQPGWPDEAVLAGLLIWVNEEAPGNHA